MDNPRFVDEETIPLVQDEDYDDYYYRSNINFTTNAKSKTRQVGRVI